ncbi:MULTISPECIES: phosphate signaling complex PhoU family protein [unclassified Saccharicrinis]|uniref:phosphate signaling complex PhoU family protein n=1 Tax=unclassified Saccharicrinis TaxID=2646859 RepID=UPI003D33E75A
MIQKEKAIKEIQDSFKDYSNLMIQQLSELENIVQSGSNSISDKEIKKIEIAEKQLNKYEVKISEKIISTISLHHPVASELRGLMACYRIVISMERIGDLVKDIVFFIRKIEDTKLYEELSDVIFNMITSSSGMVEKALLSFINEDRDSAIWTIKNDEVIDEMNKKLMKKGIKKANLQEEAREVLLHLINFKSVISKIERIGDHAGHIAEASIFAQEGRDIRHQNVDEK